MTETAASPAESSAPGKKAPSARVVAVANQKGGVGKTTTAVNLAAALAARGRRVLLVDLDAQGNASMGLGADKHALSVSAHEVLLGEATAEAALRSVPGALFGDRLWLIPANDDLTAAEVGLRGNDPQAGAQRLARALEPISSRFDDILFDCPPALSMLTLNALTAAHGVLIPMQCEYYALEGLAALRDTISRVRTMLNPDLFLEGLVRTMFDPRSNLAREVSDQLEQHFAGTLFATTIPRNVRLAEAPSHGLSVIAYDPGSKGAKAYLDLADELLARRAPVGVRPKQAGALAKAADLFRKATSA